MQITTQSLIIEYKKDLLELFKHGLDEMKELQAENYYKCLK